MPLSLVRTHTHTLEHVSSATHTRTRTPSLWGYFFRWHILMGVLYVYTTFAMF